MEIQARTAPLPKVDKSARFKASDFSEVLKVIPHECVLVGGQAVGWWADKFAIKVQSQGRDQEITSRDIDFWGSAADLLATAKALKSVAAFPNRREMTILVGAIQLWIAGKRTVLDMISVVPGIDSSDPLAVAMEEEIAGRKLLVLSPVSLVLSKLYGLRYFDQTERQDLLHLRVSLMASSSFIKESLKQESRFALWNCNRLINVQRQKPIQRLEKEHGFQIFNAIPIESIQASANDPNQAAEVRQKLTNFLTIQWPRVQSGSGFDEL